MPPTVGVDGYKWGKPLRIIAGTSDPLFQSKIKEIVKPYRIELLFTTKEGDILKSALASKPSIVVLDLESTKYDPLRCCGALEWRPDVTVWGFYPDLRKDLESEAYGVGMDGIMASSRFLERFKEYLRSRSKSP